LQMTQLGQAERARIAMSVTDARLRLVRPAFLPRCFGIYFVGTSQGNLRENKRRKLALGVVDWGSLLWLLETTFSMFGGLDLLQI
jgi:hypothetical protein